MRLPPGVERYATRRNRDLLQEAAEILPGLDMDAAVGFYDAVIDTASPETMAALGLIDRFFLLTRLLKRPDAQHPWLYDRVREVEAAPDDHLDLWAREHYKSTVITFAGAIQEVLRDPDVTIGIFSHTRNIAQKFLAQIKSEFEQNGELKLLYHDVLWMEPKKQARNWSLNGGVTVKRWSNPKEATVEAWGLVDSQPTSKHFRLRIYDDVVTRESVSTEEQVKKTTQALELSDNLGTKGGRQWYIGTRYAFGDTYGVLLDRGVVTPRIYPATEDGRADGAPVFLSPEEWEKKKQRQPSQIAAQMLQNPAAGNEATFQAKWLRAADIRPHTLKVYILCDPSKGPNPTTRTDRTAIPVIGLDAGMNWYLLDGFRHRMRLDERWKAIKGLHKKWSRAPGVLSVHVGYERYGMQTDLEHFEHRMREEKYHFPIEEVAWTREGGQSKTDRVERLVPDFTGGSFFLPAHVHHETFKRALWLVDDDGNVAHAAAPNLSRNQRLVESQGQKYRILEPIKQIDENGAIYDLTRAFIEEFQYFPFGTSKDLMDATSRIYDMDPTPPKIIDQDALDPPIYPDS